MIKAKSYEEVANIKNVHRVHENKDGTIDVYTKEDLSDEIFNDGLYESNRAAIDAFKDKCINKFKSSATGFELEYSICEDDLIDLICAAVSGIDTEYKADDGTGVKFTYHTNDQLKQVLGDYYRHRLSLVNDRDHAINENMKLIRGNNA